MQSLKASDYRLYFGLLHYIPHVEIHYGKMLPNLIYYALIFLKTYLIKNFPNYVIYYGMTIVNEAHKRFCWINSCKGDEAEQNEGLCFQNSEAKKSLK